jgi:polyhydroxybutyrate depolymerase
MLLAVLLAATTATAQESRRDILARRAAESARIPPAPGTELVAVTVDGEGRSYLLHLPRTAGTGTRPLVLVLHGAGGQGARVERLSRFSALGEAEGFITAYPNGIDGVWRPLRDPRAEIAFIRAVIEDIAVRSPVDRRRVYAAGLSNGAMMAAALGCFAPNLVAGVGLVAGGSISPCRNMPRAPAILFNGTADPLAPYEGGRRGMMPVRDFAAAWGSGQGCRAGPEALPSVADARVDRYACGGAEAVLWTIPGGTHVWPGAPGAPPGPDATRAIWRFFATIN